MATHLGIQEDGENTAGRRRCLGAVAMPLTGRSKDQRGGDQRVNSEPVVRGLSFRSYFTSSPSVCNPNLTIQRVLTEERPLARGETLSCVQHSKGVLQTSEQVSTWVSG